MQDLIAQGKILEQSCPREHWVDMKPMCNFKLSVTMLKELKTNGYN